MRVFLLLGLWFALPSPLLQAEGFSPEGLSQEARTYRQQGYEAQQGGRLDEAIASYRKAIFIDPSYAAPYNDLGIAYEALGQQENARTSYLKCVEINPHCLSAYANLAALAEQAGDLPQAIAYWTKRVQLGPPKDPWTEKAKQRLDRLTDRRSAGVLAQEQEQTPTEERERPPSSPVPSATPSPWWRRLSPSPRRPQPPPTGEPAKLRETNAALQAEVARLTTANADLERRLTSQTELARLYYEAGLAQTQAKAYPQAIAAFETSLALNPDNPEAHYHLGLLYQLARSDPEQAGAHLRAYLAMSPNGKNRNDVEALLGLMQPKASRP